MTSVKAINLNKNIMVKIINYFNIQRPISITMASNIKKKMYKGY